MIPVVNVEQMRKIEATANASGISYDAMMENAGHAAAQRALDYVAGLEEPRVVVLVGTGNNGGDGLVAARVIAQADKRIQVSLYLFKHRDDPRFKQVEEMDVFIAYGEEDDGRVIRNIVASADLLIDALFGIGVRLPIKGDAARLLRSVNQALHSRRSEIPAELTVFPTMPDKTPQIAFPRVLAIDCPSGLECDTGELDSNVISADETITFIAAKPGLLTYPGAEAVGRLSVATIGVPRDTADMDQERIKLVTAEGVRRLLPRRATDSNKGTYGKTLIVAGSTNFMGAAGLAAKSAYRAGAGLVTVGAPGNVVSVLAAQLSEPTWLVLPHDMGALSENAAPLIVEALPGYKSLLLGPGWGKEETTGDLLRSLLRERQKHQSATMKRSIGFGAAPRAQDTKSTNDLALPPLVVDADGLNLLSELENWWELLPENTIITPHPGEMSRLSKLSTEEIQQNRVEVAIEKAKAWNVILLLKGAHTVIASPDETVYRLPFKNDALATAGTGDVLAGIIAAMLCQGMPSVHAAVAAGYLHGLAGELAAQHNGSGRSVIASDVLDMIPEALSLIERR